MTRLIINADDFGLTPGINKGIIEAHKKGIITSTSLLVGSTYAKEAASLAFEHPKLSIGIHLTILGLKSVLPYSEIPTLGIVA